MDKSNISNKIAIASIVVAIIVAIIAFLTPEIRNFTGLQIKGEINSQISGEALDDSRHADSLKLDNQDNQSDSVYINFNKLPEGKIINERTKIKGNEFKEFGVLFKSIPQPQYCYDADKLVILPPPPYLGYPFHNRVANVLSSENDNNACHTIPILIRFVKPVSEVTLFFYGAFVDYNLQAFNNLGEEIDKNSKLGDLRKFTKIGVNSSVNDISRVMFGRYEEPWAEIAISGIIYKRK